MSDALEQAARVLHGATSIVAVTGAGISVESNIPAFRGPKGLWTKYPPEEYATIEGFLEDLAKVWRLWYELGDLLADSAPNPAHYALAQLEQAGKLDAIITQNVDNLHQAAGNQHVIEYHGNGKRMVCLECGAQQPIPEGPDRPLPPRCVCGGLIKPDVVMFGELIPQDALTESEHLAIQCDVMLVVGTSAEVYPAAQVPHTAKYAGAYIIEVNPEHTAFTSTITDAFLQGPAGHMLPALLAQAGVTR